MSSVAEIETAIVSLTELRQASYGDSLHFVNDELVASDGRTHFPVFAVHESSRYHDGKPDDGSASAGELIEVMYRTIDAQLAVLANARGGARDMDENATPDEPSSTLYALDLARAINGTA